MVNALWPLVVYFIAVLLMISSMLLLSYFLGQRHRERMTDDPYESGIAVTGSARLRFDIRFYLIAVFFVVFDVEAVFLYAWAVSLRETGWPGYLEAVIFMGILFVALVYLWRMGGLDWRKNGDRPKRGVNA